jgi:hypothetical protein
MYFFFFKRFFKNKFYKKNINQFNILKSKSLIFNNKNNIYFKFIKNNLLNNKSLLLYFNKLFLIYFKYKNLFKQYSFLKYKKEKNKKFILNYKYYKIFKIFQVFKIKKKIKLLKISFYNLYNLIFLKKKKILNHFFLKKKYKKNLKLNNIFNFKFYNFNRRIYFSFIRFFEYKYFYCYNKEYNIYNSFNSFNKILYNNIFIKIIKNISNIFFFKNVFNQFKIKLNIQYKKNLILNLKLKIKKILSKLKKKNIYNYLYFFYIKYQKKQLFIKKKFSKNILISKDIILNNIFLNNNNYYFYYILLNKKSTKSLISFNNKYFSKNYYLKFVLQLFNFNLLHNNNNLKNKFLFKLNYNVNNFNY